MIVEICGDAQDLTSIQRQNALILPFLCMQARNVSSAMSAASSACDHIYNWVNGTPKDTWVSMGVYSDGSYGAPKVPSWLPDLVVAAYALLCEASVLLLLSAVAEVVGAHTNNVAAVS